MAIDFVILFLWKKSLGKDCYYRVDRYDCIELIPKGMQAVQQGHRHPNIAKLIQVGKTAIPSVLSLHRFRDSPTTSILGIRVIESSESLKEYQRKDLKTEFRGNIIRRFVLGSSSGS
eukprot:755150-Hanusia_phi.AAC.5